MADIKISEMPDASPLTGTELIPIVQSGLNVKSTSDSLRSYITGSESGAIFNGLTITAGTENSILVFGASGAVIADSPLTFNGTDLDVPGTVTVGANSAAVVKSDTAQAGGSSISVDNIVTMTQTDYNALVTTDADTIYVITQ